MRKKKGIKKLWQKQIFKNYIILLFSFLLLEILFRSFGNIHFWSYSLIRIFLGINILALSFSYLFSYLPKTIAKILNCLLVLVLSIYGIIELGFLGTFGYVTSLAVKGQLKAVKYEIFNFLKSFHWTYYLLLIPFLILIIYYLFLDKKISKNIPKRKITKQVVCFKILPILVIGLLYTCFYITMNLKFMQKKFQVHSVYEVFKKPTDSTSVIQEFGYLGFICLDLKELYFPGSEQLIELSYVEKEEVDESIKEQTNIDNDLWQQIINEESDENLNILNQFFMYNDITTTNDYTGIFEGKNVIVLMLESVTNLIYNEEYYPNMARILKNSYIWDNNYAPRNSCNTINNEFSGLTGLYAIYNNCTANIYKNNTYFESLFNLFNNYDYITNSFHSHTDEYYYRSIIHPNLGSASYYGFSDLNIKGGSYDNWASDVDLINSYLNIIDELDEKKPFMSWITTLSSHHPYSLTSIYSKDYKDLFPTTYSNELKSYLSKLKVVDNALGVLLDGLEKRNLIDDTVIVLYGDHYPYEISIDKLQAAYSEDVSIDLNIDKVPFIIYNPTLEEIHFQEYTTYVNILPTIANLLGLSFDSRLYLGQDLLSEEYTSKVVFANGSWKNELAYYDVDSGKIKYYTDFTYNEQEILEINREISLKLKMSSLAIRLNYFSYLKDMLDTLNNNNKIIDEERKE